MYAHTALRPRPVLPLARGRASETIEPLAKGRAVNTLPKSTACTPGC